MTTTFYFWQGDMPNRVAHTAGYSEMSPTTGLKAFVSSFAAHVAAEAARSG